MEKNLIKEKNEIILPRIIRMIIFFYLISLTTFESLDQGIIPTSVKNIKLDLNINDIQYGAFNSLFFLGKILGSFSFIFLLNRINRKILLIISIIIYNISLFLFRFFRDIQTLYLSRIIIGFFDVFFIVYPPVWSDQFGIKSKKNFMMVLVQIFKPTGVMSGFILGTIFPWKKAIDIQIIILSFYLILSFFLNKQYFSNKLFVSKKINDNNNENNTISKFSYLTTTEKNEKNEKNEEKNEKKEKNIIITLISNPIFMIYVLARASLVFPITIIQTWIIDYLENALNIRDKKVRLISTGIITSTGPTLGIVMGGIFLEKIGGYENKKASLISVILFFFCLIGCFFFPFCNNIITVTISLWFGFFFGSSLFPILIGIILSSNKNEFRASANSMTTFICNVLGHMPAPYFYGVINQKFGKNYPKFAMKCSVFSLGICFFFLILGMVFKYNYNRKIENKDFEMESKE